MPANTLLLDLINKFDGKFRIAYSITGVLLEQLEKYAPHVLESFVKLSQTGCVEFLAETYYHSLAFLFSKEEFIKQVNKHTEKIEQIFGQTPKVFRNTELIYSNSLAQTVESMGRFKTILAEGADHVLGYRSPNFVYRPKGIKSLKLLLKNYRLSDDIAFRFSNKSWNQWPLQSEKFAAWIDAVNGMGVTVNLFMDYETFGEHQWHDTGIFEFIKHLPAQILKHPDNNFKTPSQISNDYPAVDEIDVTNITSWADTERDLSAWLSNPMQHNAISELYNIETQINNAGDAQLLDDWQKLQTSDHFYYMCTKYFADGDVHKYFNPYDSPYDSYINFMNVLDDIYCRCSNVYKEKNSIDTAAADVKISEK
jgi:alpha-amylase